ncbi:hypothetical protein [Candidatus Entotheonella palauensis]|uniref:Uncharacterized protein n=1 Tax=Candidatus Entotheonella gemina TaxID=1429439 RepID=W4M7F8_9BACT|nr:hypothetical protein [Candidatus Entotheonella palauensis]ETX05582.1 MAG: hypothetical protein ETSY2_22115 [Candidatus Entotheonella gemina]
MAKSIEDWMLEALENACADPTPLKLHGTKANPGLFLSKAAAAQAASDRCLEDGLLQKAGEIQKGRTTTALYTIAPKGVEYVLQRAMVPRLLGAMLNAAERNNQLVRQCQQSLETVQKQTQHLQGVVEQLASRVQPPDVEQILQRLVRHRQDLQPVAETNGAADIIAQIQAHRVHSPLHSCPLPDLFRQCQKQVPDLTIGQFHDDLRHLARENRIRLLPFTQALYLLQEPEYALLWGREIIYYADVI